MSQKFKWKTENDWHGYMFELHAYGSTSVYTDEEGFSHHVPMEQIIKHEDGSKTFIRPDGVVETIENHKRV